MIFNLLSHNMKVKKIGKQGESFVQKNVMLNIFGKHESERHNS